MIYLRLVCFLVLSIFILVLIFFVISANTSGLFLLYVKIHAKGSSLLCFLGFAVLLMIFFC